MLVKILTDYGAVPTVVVWDAGLSGRKELSADYKAQRRTRPDLLKLQWPHLRPLVEAFGYRNISVEGFEADDVIAALADQARDRDRANLRTAFREWELRDPLRRLEEALEAAELDAIPRPESIDALEVEVRPGTLADVARLPGDELVLVAAPPEVPEGELLATA